VVAVHELAQRFARRPAHCERREPPVADPDPLLDVPERDEVLVRLPRQVFRDRLVAFPAGALRAAVPPSGDVKQRSAHSSPVRVRSRNTTAKRPE
jgi:hypothetical protein